MHPHRSNPSDRQAAIGRSFVLVTVLVAGIGAGLILCPRASAQQGSTAALRLGTVMPGGARTSVTESWGTFECEITNPTDVDRLARVLLFYQGQREVQFGR